MNLKQLRESRNLTLKQAAALIGTTDASLCRWEAGLYSPPTKILQRIRKAYNLENGEVLALLTNEGDEGESSE